MPESVRMRDSAVSAAMTGLLGAAERTVGGESDEGDADEEFDCCCRVLVDEALELLEFWFACGGGGGGSCSPAAGGRRLIGTGLTTRVQFDDWTCICICAAIRLGVDVASAEEVAFVGELVALCGAECDCGETLATDAVKLKSDRECAHCVCCELAAGSDWPCRAYASASEPADEDGEATEKEAECAPQRGARGMSAWPPRWIHSLLSRSTSVRRWLGSTRRHRKSSSWQALEKPGCPAEGSTKNL